jgi:hypothetical protein
VGFKVPDDYWRLVIPRIFKNSVVCLNCFIELADEHFISWDKEIEFYPVSFKTHLEMTNV